MTERLLFGRSYRYLQRRVAVTQQWIDPFGRRMVHIRSTDDGPETTDGLAEASFLAVADPLNDAEEVLE